MKLDTTRPMTDLVTDLLDDAHRLSRENEQIEQENAALKDRLGRLQGPSVGTCVLCGCDVRQIHDVYVEDATGLRHLRCQEHDRANRAEAALAEKVTAISELLTTCQNLIHANDVVEQENAVLRSALKFYANPDHYALLVLTDMGGIARRTLSDYNRD